MAEAVRNRRQKIDERKKQIREAILSEERRRRASASGSDGRAAGAAATAEAASHDGKSANGVDMGRRTQSSTGASFAPRRASTGTGTGTGTKAAVEGGGQRPHGKSGRSNAQQPKPYEQVRQNFVEDTLTEFFGL